MAKCSHTFSSVQTPGSFKHAHTLSFTDQSHTLGLSLKAEAQAHVKGMVELRLWDKLRFNGSECGSSSDLVLEARPCAAFPTRLSQRLHAS